jgi:hypothetical protein
MNLDWGFYYDSWLIDKIPDVVNIKVEEHPEGIVFNPPELEFYFGANPIYLYGEGKLFHEVLFCPDGIVFYPSFLGRPGFEFVDEISFSIDFKEDEHFDGTPTVSHHIGYIDATRYIQLIMNKLYGVGNNEYVKVKTPSTRLRYVTNTDITLQDASWRSEAVFYDASDMAQNGCKFYTTMSVDEGDIGIRNEINGAMHEVVSPGAIVLKKGLFYSDVLLKYSYIEAPSEIVGLVGSDRFYMMFTTLPEFRFGTLFDFGSTNNATGPNYGFRLDINGSYATLYLNDGNLHIFDIPYDDVDFNFSHRWLIGRGDGGLVVSIDGRTYLSADISDVGNVLYNPSFKNYISLIHSAPDASVQTGDIEELAIFNNMPDEEQYDLSSFYNGTLPMLKKGGVDEAILDNTPVMLSYSLTYDKPTYFFIPNFFGGEFDKFFIVNEAGEVKVITDGKALGDYYITDMIPIKDKSLKVPIGYQVYQVTTKNQEPLFFEDIPTKIPAITKLTSDTHIPIRGKIKFKLPFFYNIPTTYNMSLNMKALSKFIVYSFKKYKTEEHI